MKKNYLCYLLPAILFLLLLQFPAHISAQTPAYAKNGGATTSNNNAWGAVATSKKIQMLYLPGNIAPAAPSGNVTKLYWMYGTTGQSLNHSYTNLTIKLGQTTNTGFSPSTTFYTGLTTVFSSASYTVTAGTSGSWFVIAPSTSFTYDNSKTLIVEISFDAETPSSGTATTGLGTYCGTSVSGQKLYASTIAATTGTTSTALQNFGMDISEPPCTDPPTPGAATISAAGCAGTTLNLSLTGNTVGSGQTYIWESAASIGGPYTPISSSSPSTAFSVSPLVTTFYRAAVTCGGSTVFSTPVEGVVRTNLTGIYTINPALPQSSTNFQSFAGVIAALNCGISGPVTFNAAAGNVFNEQVIFTPVTGASATNTITFNGNADSINYTAGTTNERATVKFNGADYITMNNFVINASAGTTYGYGVHLLNDADFNTINNCHILSSTTSTSTNYMGVVVNSIAGIANTNGDSKCDNNVFSNNNINGGAYGVILVADGPTFMINNNEVVNNTVQNFYNYGIYANGNNNLLIEGNDIMRPTRTTVTVFYGIYFDAANTNCKISKNKIHSTFDGNVASTSSNIGINFVNADATAGNENIVSNNLLYHFTGAGIHYGIQNNGSDYVKYYHNSIALENETSATGSAPTRGFYQVTASAVGIEFKNNIIKISREGTSDKVGIALAVPASVIASNNNNIIVTSSTQAYFGFTTVGYATLALWKTGTGLDVASKSVDPAFADATNGNLLPSANVINDIGAPVGIATDFTGAARSATNPDPGAYEFNAGPCTVPPTPGNAVISSGAATVCTGSAVSLDLENNSIGTGQTYIWQSSATSGSGFNSFSSPSASAAFIINPVATLYYRAAITCGAETRFSSEVLVTVSPAFAGGTYTINPALPAGGTNFQTFGNAVMAISCGVTSPVIFNVAAGTYNEQVIIPAIPGMSATNTVRFNGNGAILDYTSSNTMERATVKLNGTDYITFDNFVINANGTNGTAEYGYGVHIMGDADYNTISNCTISATQSTNATSYAGIVISGTANSATSTSGADGNIIERNTITGGYYGITLIGNTSALTQNNVISGNTVREQYSYGIYVTGTNNALIENNDISRPARDSVTAFYGIYFTGTSANARVSKNKIHDPYGGKPAATSSAFGIQLANANASLENENLVSNNIIYNFKSNGPINGLYNSSSAYTRYYHNTVSFDDQGSSTTSSWSTNGFWNSTDVAAVEFKNNIITITRNDASLKRNVLLPTTSTMVSDNNVLYLNSSSGASNYLVITGSTNYATLADWQASNGNAFDQRSKSVNPLYNNPGNADFTPTESTINNMGAAVGVLTDILNTTRLASNPDPGAYEIGNTPCVGMPTSGTANIIPAAPVCAGTPVKLSVTGHSIGGSITYQWYSSATAGGTYTPVSDILLFPDFELNAPATTTFYKLYVSCSGNTATTAALELVVKQPLSGTYTINQAVATNIITGGSNFQSFTDAQSFLSCNIAGPVVFNVSPGTYNEQLILGNISGTSATNTITFNGNGATLSYLSANTNERGIIKLNGTDYVTINNLIIEAQGTTTSQYGYGVHLLNNADNNTINNCTINLIATLTSTNYNGIVVNSTATGTATATGDSQCDNNTFSNNTITGGYVGISIIANSSTFTISNNRVLNNTISDFYNSGIHLNGNINALVEGNDISRPTRTTVTTFEGINMENVNLRCRISRNKIHDPFGGAGASASAAYGIRMSSVDASVGNENSISNNFIYRFIGGTGTQNGILINSSDNNQFYFNSILLDDASATAGDTRGMYFQPAALVGVDIRNNTITLGRAGTGAKQCIYFEPTSVSSYTINFNNYNITAVSGTLEIAHMGANGYATLADWQLATSKDDKSLSVDPLFVSSSDLHLQAGSPLKDKGVQIPGFSLDIDGTIRSENPVIGADEFGTLPATVYVFTGNGNWNNASNWSNNIIPPTLLPSGSQIFVNPSGTAVLNVPQNISAGAKITVVTGKQFIVQGNLTLQ